jgi:hypothetical protein
MEPEMNPRPHLAHTTSASPVPIPPGHVGPVALPGTGRMVWWTGRVAIGLRHQPRPRLEATSQSATWIQDLLRGSRRQAMLVE